MTFWKRYWCGKLSNEIKVRIYIGALFVLLVAVCQIANADDRPSVVKVSEPTIAERNLRPAKIEPEPYDKKAGAGVAVWVIGSAADIVSTKQALDRGCKEANRLYGDKPNTGRLIITTVVVSGILWWAGEKLGNDERAVMWGAPGALRGIAALHNTKVKC